VAVSMAVPSDGKLLASAMALAAAVAAIAVFGVVAFLLDRGDLRTVLGRLRPRTET